MRPNISYTIWFSQRNGSSLLCEGLKSTGIAGKPGELFNISEDTSLLAHYQATDHTQLQQILWREGMTANGVWGVKANAPRRINDPILNELSRFPGLSKNSPSHFEIWENAFPNHKHIFLTRRNKIRQAVSWWKAINTHEWHRKAQDDIPYEAKSILDAYNYDAIKSLLININLREAKVQEMLDQAQAMPLTIVYEDYVQQFEETIRSIISFLGIKESTYVIQAPYYRQLADEVSEIWVERFRKESQHGWDQIIW